MTGRNKDELEHGAIAIRRSREERQQMASSTCLQIWEAWHAKCRIDSYDGNAFMKPRRNKLLPRDSEVSLSRRSPVTPIPRDIAERESEIESMFRNLIRFGDPVCLHDSEHRTDRAREQHTAAWILIIAFLLISIIGFYLLGREIDSFGNHLLGLVTQSVTR